MKTRILLENLLLGLNEIMHVNCKHGKFCLFVVIKNSRQDVWELAIRRLLRVRFRPANLFLPTSWRSSTRRWSV